MIGKGGEGLGKHGREEEADEEFTDEHFGTSKAPGNPMTLAFKP